ncbi:transcription-repair coupling factor [Klugiella xanthotipulae]|uniref:Transcription-repair-coupling factor n=1 Tax=Klugiella xanthotipulae TaxID=244735 RepID=A0A543HXY3_9MICO|nr:transcription-repair coupling factor [Klugiella xanthotipulae]TQM63191.1 transcription-repair coupling factor [Klugiella xanthotipulae]
MTLHGILATLATSHSFHRALSYTAEDADFSLAEGLRAPLLAGLLAGRGGGGRASALFIVTATGRESESLRMSLAALLPDVDIVEFPAWETLPHERLSPSAETVGHRLTALRTMSEWRPESGRDLIVIGAVRAALQPLADNLLSVPPLHFVTGGRGHDLTEVSERLVALAYARVDMVTRRGEFSVRGGLLDVFSPVAEHPVRIEFFGDEVEEIRPFSVADQRSLPVELTEATLVPSRELLLDEGVRQRAREMQSEFPNLSAMLEKVAEGIPAEGMESLTPALVERLVPITHYLPAEAAVAVIAPERVATRAVSLAETNREFLAAAWNAATAGADAPIDLASGDFLSLNTLRGSTGERPWWTLSSFQRDEHDPISQGIDGYVRIEADAVPSFQGSIDGAVDYVGGLVRDGWRVVVTAQGQGTVERVRDVLSEHEVAGRVVPTLEGAPEALVATLVACSIDHGFVSTEARLAVLTEAEFFGRSATYQAGQVKKLASSRKNVVDPLQLAAGDFVVHETHGIGRFIELTQREITTGSGRNATKALREYLALEYAPSKRGYPADKLFVPTDQLDQLSRYVGGEAPALSKMGGSDWSAAKGRARKAVRDIAVELVKLYSARMASKGFAFSPDTPWQRELEEAFPFVETPDQLTTINDVKRDMESPIPMDRLVSGDVGFGKTEIAVRAAFKAVQDGKQVAMLVPTTLLVKQHLETFQERFAGFPVHLRALSRFQTDKEAREVLDGLASGSVDVVIGTHRLLAASVVYKDLGLVIVDEEQRFGVEHKDALKKLKTNVDILAMSATPIPRTLEMAVTGIREMSTLATPPEDRHPILTFVGPRSDRQIAAAIRRELLREGQIFFVHNRVSSITRTAAHLAELVPEARIAIAHGKLSEATLEQVVVDFWERKFDVLVSTTIVETGLDIANANTIIIDRADKYGLSQLHQLRGRVGRGRERAYGYFMYDEDRPLSETAHERLETIATNNELGSGMQVALKDLEIRGAGNLLGGEQSGHIAGVGFDLYLRMIGEAVSTFRGEATASLTELNLELPVVAHIPEDYVESERLRLEAYQKFSTASSSVAGADQLDLVMEELADRYGTPPAEVENLLRVSRLRRLAGLHGLSKVVVLGPNLKVERVDLPDSRQMRMMRLYPGSRYVNTTGTMTVPLPVLHGVTLGGTELIDWVRKLVEVILPELPEAATESAGEASGD